MISDVAATFVELVGHGGLDLPNPGAGHTSDRFAALLRLARRDVVLARLAEGHADALAIVDELGGERPTGAVWGVWAAVPRSLTATKGSSGWTVTGTRPWCSGAGVCTRALVTAEALDGPRLFAVDVRDPSVHALEGTWPALGMARSDSRSVRFRHTPAEPVGDVNSYVDRPGFWHGAIGVAACWLGGAAGVADALLHAARAKQLDPHAVAHLGAVDATLVAAGTSLAAAARQIDEQPHEDHELLAGRVRAVVEDCVTKVIDRVGRALGATPLCQDAGHAGRVADLTVYVRQSHAERDLERLGSLVADGEADQWEPPW